MRQILPLLQIAFVLCLAGPSAAEDIITLGFIAPLTGEAANFGSDGRRAVEMAVEDIHSSNMLPGKKLAVVYEDGHCSGKESSIAASKLVRVDHVQAIIHAGCSSEALGAAQVVEHAKVILIASASESADLTYSGDYVFRISPNVRMGGTDLADWTREDGIRTIALLSENSDYAISLRDIVASRLKEHGISIIEDVTYDPGLNDFRTILMKLRARMPGAIFVNPQTGLKGGLIIKQLRELNWSLPIYGNYAFNLLDTANAAGGFAVLEGIKFIDYPVVNSPRGEELLKRFQSRFGPAQSDYNVAATYDALLMLASAIKEKGYNASAIRDYWYALPQFEGAAFTYKFDQYGDAQGVHYSRKIIKDAKVTVLKP